MLDILRELLIEMMYTAAGQIDRTTKNCQLSYTQAMSEHCAAI